MKGHTVRASLLGGVFLVSIMATCLADWAMADSISVNVRISLVKLFDGTEAGDDELYSKVNIANKGLQSSSTVDFADGQERLVNWTFSRTINARDYRSSGYQVPINIQLWEADPLFDDRIDINPVVGTPDLSFNHNLKDLDIFDTVSRMYVPGTDGSSTGTFPEYASLEYEVRSTPFSHGFLATSEVTDAGPLGFRYRYTLTNNGNIDLMRWSLGGIAVPGPLNLAPGSSFQYEFFSPQSSVKTVSSALFEDGVVSSGRSTGFIDVPVPEPGSLILFASGLVGLSAWRWKRVKKA